MRRTVCIITTLACASWVQTALATAGSSDLANRLVGDYVPQNPQSGGLSPLFGLGISILLVAAIVSASLIPSKRGHQD
ncbi:MAG: hypothetical protein GY876_09515 [Planctomycetes bacterium]|nr:hypothetical protein [Planctomycetota bacterium]